MNEQVDNKSFLEYYGGMIDTHLASIKALLANANIRKLGWEYRESKNSQPSKPFNVFTIASDLYYRENFHSDVIKAFLDPSEAHNEGTMFLFSFIDFINNSFGDKIDISKRHYTETTVEREPGKIDILIRSEVSKHCIIIENKMNNAGDMQRQLPRYYDFMHESGYTVDAIVYLPLEPNKQPDQSSWTDADKEHVLPLLCVVPAYQKSGVNLVKGWIEPCILMTKDIDCISTLRQYGELIKTLSNNIMDNVILEKFYNTLLDKENLLSAQSIRNMLNDIPAYMKDRLLNRLKSDGFTNAWSWRPTHCGIRINKGGYEYKIDVWSTESGYSVQVFGQGISLNDVPWSDDILRKMEELHFMQSNERYQKVDYSFNDEACVINDVETLARLMEEMLK